VRDRQVGGAAPEQVLPVAARKGHRSRKALDDAQAAAGEVADPDGPEAGA